MRNKILYLLIGIVVALAGSDKALHEIPTDKPEGENIVSVGLNTDKAPDTPLNDAHLFWFDETDMLSRHDYYGSMEELAKAERHITQNVNAKMVFFDLSLRLTVLIKR